MNKKIKIGIVGVGNCASSLIQGIEYYKHKSKDDAIGLMHWEIGGYKPYDIEVVCAFDIDKRKVGKKLTEAIFEKPNCTKRFVNRLNFVNDAIVSPGIILDGVSKHMLDQSNDKYFLPIDKESNKESDSFSF